MTATGCFVSDLHLLTSRSSASRYLGEICEAATRSRVFVFGGDVFDFRWAGIPIEHAARDAAQWLREFAESCPDCQFHYLLGNHDHHEVFIERLMELDRDIANLAWDRHLLRIGDKVFLHGDVLDRDLTAECLTARRTRSHQHRVRDAWEHDVYDWAVRAGLHRPVPFLVHPTRLVARRLLRYLRRTGHGPESGVREVYFGHIHRVIRNYAYHGLCFHSGGAAIRGLPFAVLEFLLDASPTASAGG